MNSFSSNVCIFHPGALGDGLLSLKAVRTVQRQLPDHEVIWFGHKELGEVFVACQEVSQAYSFDDIHFLHSENIDSLKEGRIPALFSRCERVIGWMDDSDGRWKECLYSAGIKTALVRSPHDPTLHTYHMSDRYLETLMPSLIRGIPQVQFEQEFHENTPLAFLNLREIDARDSSQGPLIILHPGSGSSYKCASSRMLATLAKGLMAVPGRRLCVVGGPADHESVQQLQAAVCSIEMTVLQDMDLLSMTPGRH